jgi:PKHD-type hydroxylase
LTLSVYHFLPSPSFGAGEANVATWKDGFTSEELKKIISLGQQRNPEKAVIGGYNKNENYSHVRKSLTSWLEAGNETDWIYQRLGNIARNLNGQHFRFDLWGFGEHLQFTEYHGTDEGHYSWHIDSGLTSTNYGPRKLSIVVQLSDPSEYEGGNLQVNLGSEPQTISKDVGLVCVFPSFVLHRVTPVTSGVRRTLVAWLTGPALR